jgi:hypothetical protein
MECLAIEVFESLVEATYSKGKLVLLKKVNLELEKFLFSPGWPTGQTKAVIDKRQR